VFRVVTAPLLQAETLTPQMTTVSNCRYPAGSISTGQHELNLSHEVDSLLSQLHLHRSSPTAPVLLLNNSSDPASTAADQQAFE
jgi:hypothetical protein